MKKKLLASSLLVACLSLSGFSQYATAAQVTADHTAGPGATATAEKRQLILDGITYQVPMTYTAGLDQYGWTFKDTDLASKELYPGESVYLDVTKDNVMISIVLANLDNEKKPAYNTTIVSFHLSNDFIKNSGMSITLPGELDIHDYTSIEQIIEKLGDPASTGRHDSSSYRHYWFDIDKDSKWNFDFNEAQYNILDSIALSCIDKVYNKQQEIRDNNLYESFLQELSPAVLAYQEPVTLGNDILSGTIEYKGDLYQFPIPVAAFQKNGWKLYGGFPYETAPRDETAYIAGGYEGIGLSRGMDEISNLAYNLGETPVTQNNLFIQAMGSSEFTPGLVLPGGIRKGSSRSELLAALDGINFELEEDIPNNTDNYTLSTSDESYVIKIDFDRNKNEVEYIFIFSH